MASCGTAPPRHPNILLVVVDTLRPDHLGCHGYFRDTSPALDAVAARGYRFERAYSTAPWTMSSVASMFTGLYPGSHGVTSVSKLPDEALTLAEILHDSGYATAGVVSHLVLGREYDFDQGFEEYEDRIPGRPHSDVSTARVTSRAIEFLDGLAAGERPFFLFAHYFDPHYDYIPHEEVDFAPPRAGRLDGNETIKQLRAAPGGLTGEELAFIEAVYDEEIRHTDDGIGRLLAHLEELGLDDRTWVIVTADHGEEFLTHGWLGHTRTLYEELIHVPLLVRPPGGLRRSRTPQGPVSLAALPATILDLAGVDPAPFAFQVGSLAPLLGRGGDDGSGAVFAEVDFIPLYADNWIKRAHKKALVTARYKLIRDDVRGWLELYDLEEDPAERNDLAAIRPDVVGGLLPALEQAVAVSRERAARPVEAPLTEERLEQLRSLGYVGN